MYLLDTSVWLERLLDQERSDDVKLFLDNVDSSALAITDFSYHSIGLILSRLSRNQVYIDFTRDLFLDSSVEMVLLYPEEISSVVNTINQFNLDFDDAYQYVAANRKGINLVTFDQDFQKTDIEPIPPGKAAEQNLPNQ